MTRIDADANEIYSNRRKEQQAKREAAADKAAAEHAGQADASAAAKAPWDAVNAAAIYERRRQEAQRAGNGRA
ncbi:hypothetical protein ACVIW2_005063 [Bradyrhizobium huanghuaihaiense]